MSEAPVCVALDATPLLGPPAGIHQATSGLMRELGRRDDVNVLGYVLSARASKLQIAQAANAHEVSITDNRIPRGAQRMSFGGSVVHGRLPAGLCHRAWARCDFPKLKRLVDGAELVHGTNYTVPPGPNRLITVQDLTPLTHPEWCSPAVRRMVPALRRAVRRGAHLHVTTQAAAYQAGQLLGADPQRVHVIPIGLHTLEPADPPATHQPTRADARTTRQRTLAGNAETARRRVGAERFVLALGTTEPRKGLRVLIDAMAALPTDVKLAVAGTPGSDEAALGRAVQAQGLTDRWVRLTQVDEPFKADLLSAATVLAYPSLAEGFGIPPLEAVLAGTPVVATAVGALPDLLEPEIALVAPGDDVGLIERIAATVNDPPEIPDAVRERLGRLTWASAAEQTVDAYRQIIRRG